MPRPPSVRGSAGAPRDRVVRDPALGYVDVPGELDALVRSAAVQRLRSIAQNARATVRYPSMTGSRFEHALGTMHLARRAWHTSWAQTVAPAGHSADETRDAFRRDVITGLRESDRDRLDACTASLVAADRAAEVPVEETGLWEDFERLVGLAVGAVGLVHDLGHPPFSHVLEPFYDRHAETVLGPEARRSLADYRAAASGPVQLHEWAGLQIVDDLPEATFRWLPRALARRILAARSSSDWAACLHGIIDGQFDVDRLDYLVRDSTQAGTEFGAIDTVRLLGSLELHRVEDGWRIGLGARSVSAFETLLVQRAQHYRWVVHHYAVVAADTALERAVDNVYELTRDGVPDPAGPRTHDLDYVSAAADESTRGGVVIDDHDCLTWLRAARPGLERRAALPEAEGRARRVRATLGMLRLCDGFDLNPVPAWRNYQEFVARAEQCADVVDALLDRHPAAESAPDDLMTGPGGRRAVSSLLADTPARLNAALDAAVAAALDGSDGAVDGPRWAEALLDRTHPEVPICGGPGFWLVARVPFRPFQDDFAKVWRGDEEVALSEVSPFPLALTAIEVMRPRYLAYFVPLEQSGADATREQRREVGRLFLETLACSPGIAG